MTARHRQNPTPDQARVRLLVMFFLLVFVVGAVFFRDGGGTPGPTTTRPPTTTPNGDGSTTLPDGSTVPSSTTPQLGDLKGYRLEVVHKGLRDPVKATAPVGDDRVFIVQRHGIIRVVDGTGTLLPEPFLDLTDRVLAGGIEQGLLGLAFHPDYEENGRFFVYYTSREHRQVTEFKVSSSDPNKADRDSEKVVIREVRNPPNASEPRHYGGDLNFGPDGYLWASIGDGAASRDQGQNPNTIYGTIIRIDVDGGDPYAVPSDNPFVNGGGKAEVWAYGLRNPWRFSIDPVDGYIYIGDVGHADIEEINAVPISQGGYNFGWSDMEGTRCFHKRDCNAADYTSPVLTYTHEDGLSVTGGFVYRGPAIPELHGTYFYADWVGKWLRSFKLVDGQVTEEKDWTQELGGDLGYITAFGLDGNGELLFTTWSAPSSSEGTVYRLVAVR